MAMKRFLTALLACTFPTLAVAADIYQPPINYETAVAENSLTRLQKQLATGEKKLTF